MDSVYRCRGFFPLTLTLCLFLLGLTLIIASPARLPVEEYQSPQQCAFMPAMELTLLNWHETYHDFPTPNIADVRHRSQVTLTFVVRFKNITSERVLTLDTDCFRIVRKLVFAQPLVSPAEGALETDSTPDGSGVGCRSYLHPHAVTLLPGESYETTRKLKFAIVDDVVDHPHSLKPGSYFLQVTVATGVGWDVHDEKGWRQIGSWVFGFIDSEPMRFIVKRRSRQLRLLSPA